MDTEVMHTYLTLHRRIRRYSRELCGGGLSGRKISALRYLLEAGPRTIGQIRDYLFIGDSSTSELVRSLKKDGYVTRNRSVEDDRVVIVNLTASGASVAKTAPLGGMPLLRERLKTLNSDELSSISVALNRMLGLLEEGNDC